jgi:hypothetical protein
LNFGIYLISISASFDKASKNLIFSFAAMSKVISKDFSTILQITKQANAKTVLNSVGITNISPLIGAATNLDAVGLSKYELAPDNLHNGN